MRAERFPFGRHDDSDGVAGNSGWSAASDDRCLVASTLTTFFSLGLGFVETLGDQFA
jgi:hypothetical protein